MMSLEWGMSKSLHSQKSRKLPHMKVNLLKSSTCKSGHSGVPDAVLQE